MIKICGKSICKPSQLIFNQCIDAGSFQLKWKKASIVPIHKKGGDKCLKNYRPVSLLPIYGKILERLMKCSGFLLKTIWYPQINLVSSKETPVITSFYV